MQSPCSAELPRGEEHKKFMRLRQPTMTTTGDDMDCVGTLDVQQQPPLKYAAPAECAASAVAFSVRSVQLL